MNLLLLLFLLLFLLVLITVPHIRPVTSVRACSVTFFFTGALSLDTLYVSTLGSGLTLHEALSWSDTIPLAIVSLISIVVGRLLLWIKRPILHKSLIVKRPVYLLGLLAVSSFLVSSSNVLGLYLLTESIYTIICAIMIHSGKLAPFTEAQVAKWDLHSLASKLLSKLLTTKFKFVLGCIFVCLIFVHDLTVHTVLENAHSLLIANQSELLKEKDPANFLLYHANIKYYEFGENLN